MPQSILSLGITDRESSDPYYDLIEDFGLIVSSFQTQYGIRLSKDLAGMKWDEFADLIAGLGPETPLGRMVAIRSEDDKEVLKHFTKEQRRILSEWRSRQAKAVSKAQAAAYLETIKQALIKMAGGV